jgi:hypothetical protein
VSQERQIGSVVADVIEGAGWHERTQDVELVAAGEVSRAVAAENAGEDAEVIGDAAGEVDVSAGCKVDRSASGMFCVEEFEEGAVIREVLYIEGDGPGDTRLERGLAVK